MKKPQMLNIFIEAVTIVFILIFTHTAYNKIQYHESLTDSLSKFPIIGAYPAIFTWAIPAAEIVAVFLLVVPKFRLMGLKVSVGLMITFTAYIVYLFLIDDKMPCTCGGMIERLTWSQHLLFNISLLFLGTLSILCQTGKKRNHYSPKHIEFNS